MGFLGFFDKHFRIKKGFIEAVVDTYNFNKHQADRFKSFCENFQTATHTDNEYKKLTRKEQADIIHQVIEGIRQTPVIENYITFESRNEFPTPKVNGEEITKEENPGLYWEIQTAAAASYPEDELGSAN